MDQTPGDIYEREAGLTVRYRGELVDSGMMNVDTFVPVIRGLQRTLERAAAIVDEDAEDARVYITADFKQSSFEFHVLLQEIAVTVVTLLSVDGGQSAVEAVSKLFSAGSSLIELIKKLGGADEKNIDRTAISDNAVQYNVRIEGNNNAVFIVPKDVSRLEQDPTIRQYIEDVIEPLLAEKGLAEVQFLPDDETLPTTVGAGDAAHFISASEPEPIDDSFHIVEQVVAVIKPAFARKRRWRLRDDKGNEFGATMEDVRFQRDVVRRLILFGAGDQLRVRMAVRLHAAAAAEYRIVEVLAIIRPEEPPSQLRLA